MALAVDDDEFSRRISLTGLYINVDNLTREDGIEEYVGARKEITKHHWKPVSQSSKCFNQSCQKSLTYFGGRSNCRRCGETFCTNCLQYKRRLNYLAHFDPSGQLYKVCKSCFETDRHTDGQVQSHTSHFNQMRSYLKKKAANSNTRTASTIWKCQTDFDKECKRLLDGFASSIGKSEIMKTFQDVKSVVSVPDWMKSSVWMQENMIPKCRVCTERFGLIKKKQFCCVCGTAVCKTCTNKDLLLYVPDEERNKVTAKLVKMAIIKIVGCPEVEPEISLHIRICPTCKEKLITQQVDEWEDEDQGVDLSFDFMETLDKLHQKFHKSEEGVLLQLPNYSSIVESLEDNSRTSSEKSNMKMLAKAQEDLTDALAVHITLVQQVKKLKPTTCTQMSLLKTFLRAKCEFYVNNMSSFRIFKHKLEQTIPSDSLDFIQRTMDKNAIISTHLALRQLVYEVLHLTQRWKIDDKLPEFLITVEQEVEDNVKKCLLQGGEDVDQHLDVVKEMTRSAIKDHKLIRLPRRALKTEALEDIHRFILSRSENILNQVVNQLQLASANRSFQSGKKTLDEAVAWMKNCQDCFDKEREEEREEDGFVLF